MPTDIRNSSPIRLRQSPGRHTLTKAAIYVAVLETSKTNSLSKNVHLRGEEIVVLKLTSAWLTGLPDKWRLVPKLPVSRLTGHNSPRLVISALLVKALQQ